MVKHTVPEICLLAPTDAMLACAAQLVHSRNLEIGLFRADIETIKQTATELSAQGATIFISRRGASRVLESFYPNHVVSVGSPLPDFIPAMEAAAKLKGKIAFFNHRSNRPDVRAMCYLLHLDALFYSFNTAEECQQRVRQAKQAGAVLCVGGADAVRYAEQLGMKHCIIESSEQSILDGIARAQQMLHIEKAAQEKQLSLRVRLERYETVLRYTHDAIMAIDEHGNVDVVNPQAEKLLRKSRESILGKPVETVIPNTKMRQALEEQQVELDQLMEMGSTMVTTNRVPILIDGAVRGVVATFQDVKALQASEKKIRLKLYEKGLVAKYTFSDIKGQSDSLKKSLAMAQKYARSSSTILIHGETGTGKELFAQSIHNASTRAKGPFVAINCGSLPQNLLEAELFGYAEGAFTGALKGGKMGLFEVAHGGTIFLDEIGEMPLETQVHLLRVLQEKEIRRLGSDTVTPVDIRVVTATNRDLRKMIARGSFREDLYYRINVLNLEIAPLRERRADLREIAMDAFHSFLGTDLKHETVIHHFIERMQSYSWPGNARELCNMVERICVLLTQGENPAEVIDYVQNLLFAQDVDELGRTPQPAQIENAPLPPLHDVEAWQRQRILAALRENNYEMTNTAKSLGIGRTTLWRRMKKYQIKL